MQVRTRTWRRRRLVAGGATVATVLLAAVAPAAQAAELDGEPEVAGVQYRSTECARNELSVVFDVAGTTDDGDGGDQLTTEVWDDFELKDAQTFTVPVGEQREIRSHLTFRGLYGEGVAGVGVYVVDTAGEERRALSHVDPFVPADDDGECGAVERIAGASRVETAARQAERFVAADTVLLATARSFADALVAGPLAAAVGAPILLIEPDVLPQPVVEQLERLAPRDVLVVGGEAAVSAAVVDAVRLAVSDDATVRRVGGSSRYETAALLVDELRGRAETTPGTVYLSTGRTFPDALVGGALAAREGAPVLLTDPERLSPASRAVLTDSATTEVVVLGGSGAVSDAVVAEVRSLGLPVERLGGQDRYETAARIIARFPPGDEIFVATGRDFPDALSAVPVAARDATPLVLVDRDGIPGPIREQLTRLTDERDATIVVLGGEAAVGPAVERELGRFGSLG